MDEQQYKSIEQQITPPIPYAKNIMKAFLIGGLICTIGHAITYFYIIFFDFTETTVGNPTAATMVFIAMILTGIGVYGKIAQFAGAGSGVPVTGFGNAVVSAAIEHRTEGFIQGVGGNMFKLAGAVILFGVASAFVISLIKLILVTIGVIEW